jgi:hypothetical protein
VEGPPEPPLSADSDRFERRFRSPFRDPLAEFSQSSLASHDRR